MSCTPRKTEKFGLVYTDVVIDQSTARPEWHLDGPDFV